jgi:hypothetical protein
MPEVPYSSLTPQPCWQSLDAINIVAKKLGIDKPRKANWKKGAVQLTSSLRKLVLIKTVNNIFNINELIQTSKYKEVNRTELSPSVRVLWANTLAYFRAKKVLWNGYLVVGPWGPIL